MTPAGIETATLRFVVQHLNHCATAVPMNLSGKLQNPSDFKSVIGRSLRNKREAPYMDSRSIRPTVYDLVSETKPFVGFSCNTVYELFTKPCRASVNLVKIASVTRTLYLRAYSNFHTEATFRIPSLILVKHGTGELHIMPLSNSEFLYTSLGASMKLCLYFLFFFRMRYNLVHRMSTKLHCVTLSSTKVDKVKAVI